MNDDPSIRERILTILGDIAPDVDLASLPDDAPLREELDLDSIDVQRLMSAIYEQLGVDVPEREYGRLHALDDLVAYVAPRS